MKVPRERNTIFYALFSPVHQFRYQVHVARFGIPRNYNLIKGELGGGGRFAMQVRNRIRVFGTLQTIGYLLTFYKLLAFGVWSCIVTTHCSPSLWSRVG